MGTLLSPRFWVSTIASVIVTMIFIYFIKKASEKYNIPVLSEVSAVV